MPNMENLGDGIEAAVLTTRWRLGDRVPGLGRLGRRSKDRQYVALSWHSYVQDSAMEGHWLSYPEAPADIASRPQADYGRVAVISTQRDRLHDLLGRVSEYRGAQHAIAKRVGSVMLVGTHPEGRELFKPDYEDDSRLSVRVQLEAGESQLAIGLFVPVREVFAHVHDPKSQQRMATPADARLPLI